MEKNSPFNINIASFSANQSLSRKGFQHYTFSNINNYICKTRSHRGIFTFLKSHLQVSLSTW